MIKTYFEKNEKCQTCAHFGFCSVYWGTDCKRQGGNKTPRLNQSVAIKKDASMKKKTLLQKKIQHKCLAAFDPITTRRVNWHLT